MREINNKNLARASLLLAVMVVLQSIHLYVPLPFPVSMFVVGSAINSCLLIAVEKTGKKYALILSCVYAIVAYSQQTLGLPILIIPVVAGGNAMYVWAYSVALRYNRWLAVLAAAFCRMMTLLVLVTVMFQVIVVPEKVMGILRFMLSWPQFITGAGGALLCSLIIKRI